MTQSPHPASQSARFFLREDTGVLHAELDAILSRADLGRRDAYARFLAAQAAPLFAIEAALEHAGVDAVLADWPQRRRSDAMHADLAVLGTQAPAPAVTQAIDGVDDMFGALYVLEGSRLGAKFLVRAARASEDEAVRTATAYLGHGAEARFWPTFLEALADREAQGLDRERLVAGARDAFAAFIASAKADASEPHSSTVDTPA